MKKSVRYLALAAMSLASCLSIAACNGGDKGPKPIDLDKIKVAMVCIGDTSTSTYDRNFKNGLDAAATKLGLNLKNQVFYYEAKGEGDDAKAAAMDAAEDGADIILLDSYGHQYFADAVAKKYPDVQVVSCTGDLAHTQKIENLANAFANIYEGRYLAGIAAGMRLNAMGDQASDHVLGYVAAWPFSEVISGYTAFYLGAKSVCPDVTMKYRVTSSWGDSELEKTAAEALIAAGCKVISQHADTYGAPGVCETTKNANEVICNVSYNVATNDQCPETYLCSSRINWEPYFEYVIKSRSEGKFVEYDWCGGLKEGSVVVGDLGKLAPDGTQAKIDEAKAKIIAGTLHVFDTSTFTVSADNNPFSTLTVDANGKLTSFMADVDPDDAYTGDTQVVHDGYFDESNYRSAPYFNCNIDGISELASAE